MMAPAQSRSVVLPSGVGVDVTLYGTGRPAVVLLAGGASSTTGFFPGLLERLAPRTTVVVHDRPGTGATAAYPGSVGLRAAAADVAAVVRAVTDGPVVVVGQSLGGLLCLQIAADFPDLVRGAVLIDPTPVNAPRVLRSLLPMTTVLARLASLPLLGRAAPAVMTAGAHRAVRGWNLAPTAQAALDRIASDPLPPLADIVRGLPDDAAALWERLQRGGLPEVELDVLTGDRKPAHAVRRAHEELARIAGGRCRTWPGVGHVMHLQVPDAVAEVVLEMVEGLR